MNPAMMHDIGAYLHSEYAMDSTSATAAGSGDNTEVNGAGVDRSDYLSAKLVIQWEATLAEGETLSLTANAQDDTVAAFSGTPADFGDALAKTVVATGGTGGSTEKGTTELDFDLAGARQFIRSQVTPDLSASATDTAKVSAVWVFGGKNELPIS